LLSNAQRPLQQGSCLGIVPGSSKDGPEIAQAGGNILVAWPKRPLTDLEGPSIEVLSIPILPGCLQQQAKLIQARSHVCMVRPKLGFADFQSSLIDESSLRILPSSPQHEPQIVQARRDIEMTWAQRLLAKRKSFARFRKRLPIVTAISKTNYFCI
jgi:hypothetical protein